MYIFLYKKKECVRFFAHSIFFEGGTNIFLKKYLCNNKSINLIYVHLSYPRNRTLGNPGEYLWEYK